MIYLIVFVTLSSPSFQGVATAAMSNGRHYSAENSDIEGSLARVNRGAFTDWFLANKGVSEDSTDEVDSFVVSNSFLSKWCEWFGKRGNGSTQVTNASLCKTYRDYVMHMQTATTPSPLANSAASTAATNNAKFVDYENSVNVSSHSSGSHPRSRQTVIIVRRIVEEYSRKKRNDDENDTASGEDGNEVKYKFTTQDDKISKSSSSESAQDTSSVEQGHGRPYFFVR